jgi:hypothetical protein
MEENLNIAFLMQYLERLADQLRRLGPGRPELNLERRPEARDSGSGKGEFLRSGLSSNDVADQTTVQVEENGRASYACRYSLLVV